MMSTVFLTLVAIAISILLVFIVAREESRMKTVLGKAHNTRDSLLAIAHEIRTPLTNIRSYNRLLRQGEFGDLSLGQMEALHTMDTETETAIIVLNRLLAASRIEFDGITAHPIRNNIRMSVQAAINALKSTAEDLEHTVKITGSSEPMYVMTDPLVLHGIIDALLENALVYTPQKGTITITTLRRGTRVFIEIKDTGIGFTKEERGRMFEKFFRGTRARRMYHGSGMGLSIAKTLADTMHGTITLSSTSPKGSVMTISLPLTKGKAEK